jgi:hypothetical protein
MDIDRELQLMEDRLNIGIELSYHRALASLAGVSLEEHYAARQQARDEERHQAVTAPVTVMNPMWDAIQRAAGALSRFTSALNALFA